ncbi:MAG: PadR family transcriptional regulator [Zestosphaera sp.]
MIPGRMAFRGYMKLVTLNILRGQPKHAYGLIKSLEDLVGMRPSTGVVYPVLRKSIQEGLVEVEMLRAEGREVKVYKLSEKGLEYLKLHEGELREALRLAESFRKFRQAGCDRLLELVRELVKGAGRLSESELIELRRAIADFETRVLEILASSKV